MGHDETPMACDARWDDAMPLRMRIAVFRWEIDRADRDSRVVAVGAGRGVKVEVAVIDRPERDARLPRISLTIGVDKTAVGTYLF